LPELFNEKGRYITSQHINSCTTAFTDKSPRILNPKAKLDVPGPGNYNYLRTITGNGKIQDSRFRSTFTRSFAGICKRENSMPTPSNRIFFENFTKL